ncbi:MAG: DUF106 domain-containing protein [Methanosarcinaceae archaeon]|nr:DUF106 domain-containing protein [Methanosarcinaceae archaeon]
MFIGVMIPGVRTALGRVVDIFMFPVLQMIGESNFFLLLSVMAIITATYSALIQKYVVDQSKMKEFQAKMKLFQEEFKEAQNTQNTYMLKRLEEQQIEMLQEQNVIMKEQFKPMFYIVIISLPLFMWAYYYINGNSMSSIVFPFWGEQSLGDFVFFTFQYWIYWYFVSSLAFNQIFRKVMDLI